MNPLEDELRSALRRRDPPPDFTARVLARAAGAPPRRGQRSWVRWVVPLAACLVLGAGTAEYRHYRGEQAKKQVLMAVRIAASKLNKAQKKVQMLNATHRSNS